MRIVSFIVFVVTIGASGAVLAEPLLLPVQGRLLDSSGQPIVDPQFVDFRIYDAPLGGTSSFEETQQVQFSDGYFAAYIGENEPLAPSLFHDSGALWLGVQVGSDSEMTPRIRLGAAPNAAFAQLCGDAETLGSLGPETFATVSELAGYSPASHDHTGSYAPAAHGHAISSSDITNGTIATVDLANNAVTSEKVANGSLTASDIANDSITDDKLAQSYSPHNHGHAGAYATTTHGHADLTAAIASHSHAVTSSDILDGTITSDDLATNSVTTAQITDGTIQDQDLASTVGIRGWEIVIERPLLTGTGLRTIYALCSPGKKVLGGGVQGLGDDSKLRPHLFGPIIDEEPDREDGSGYRFHFHKHIADPITPTVIAICAYVSE